MVSWLLSFDPPVLASILLLASMLSRLVLIPARLALAGTCVARLSAALSTCLVRIDLAMGKFYGGTVSKV